MHGDSTQPDDDLVRLVRQALEALERGEEVDPLAICGSRPELAPALQEALGLSDGLARVQTVARDTDPLQGRVLGRSRYELGRRIGTGAMGVVYEATDRELRRQVAVKILDARLFQRPDAEARFQREAESLARFQHDHVVRVHDRGRSDDGIHFLVMEHLRGASLAAVLAHIESHPDGGDRELSWLRDLIDASTALPEPTLRRLLVRWAAEVAEALAAAHAEGVMHRDVKPSNVFITRDARAVLLDFGIAARDGDAGLTATRTTLGTPWYMAPEQAAGGWKPDPRVDVYGLAATLYHLLAGRPPFDGEPAEVFVRVLREEPTPLLRLRPDLPRDLLAIVETGMAPLPQHRYRGAAAMAVDLRAFLDHRPVSARPLSPWLRALRRARRAPARAAAWTAGVVAVLLLAVVVPLWQARRGTLAARERQQLLAELPSLVALEGMPADRLLVPLAEIDEVLGTLDRLLELQPDDASVRLIRAALHLDHGDHAAAAADLDHLQRQQASPYLRAVSARYAAADRSVRGAAAVDLSDLGVEPGTAADHFVAGFHALRDRVPGNPARADEHLAKAAATFPPARDLRLIALVTRGEQEGKRSLFEEAWRESLELRGRYGHDTARTAAIRGVALIVLGRYREAIEPLLHSLELRPGRHQPLQNLGVAYRRVNDPENAMRYLEQAAQVRPQAWNTRHTMAQVWSDCGEFARALALARSLPTEGADGVGWKREELLGSIHLRQAGACRIGGDATGMAEHAQLAARHYGNAFAVAPERPTSVRASLAAKQAAARAAASGDLANALKNLLRTGGGTDDPYQIANLANCFPEGALDPETAWLVLLHLRRQAMRLGDGDERFVTEQRRLLRAASSSPPPDEDR